MAEPVGTRNFVIDKGDKVFLNRYKSYKFKAL